MYESMLIKKGNIYRVEAEEGELVGPDEPIQEVVDGVPCYTVAWGPMEYAHLPVECCEILTEEQFDELELAMMAQVAEEAAGSDSVEWKMKAPILAGIMTMFVEHVEKEPPDEPAGQTDH